VKSRPLAAEGTTGIDTVRVVDRLGVLVAMKRQILSLSLAAGIRKIEVYLKICGQTYIPLI
jgi:hypothetical protein